MSITWKIVLGIVIVLAVVLGWKFMKSPTGTDYEDATSSENSTYGVSKGNSDESLDQDVSSIDAQLKIVNTSSSEVDESFQDKPVSQTE